MELGSLYHTEPKITQVGQYTVIESYQESTLEERIERDKNIIRVLSQILLGD